MLCSVGDPTVSPGKMIRPMLPVVIVNQTLARRYFPDGRVIGQRVGFDKDPVSEFEIVGVVRDSKYSRQRNEVFPLVFFPWRQHLGLAAEMSFAVRTAGDPLSLVPAVRRLVQDQTRELALAEVTTQATQTEKNIAAETLMARLLACFGALAALLSALGIYGILSYAVAQETTEIGIRMALGAAAARVRRRIVWRGLKLAGGGVLLGALAALGLERVVESQLYGVRPTDPATFLAVMAGLLGVALLACWVPALRATRVDPMIALRNE